MICIYIWVQGFGTISEKTVKHADIIYDFSIWFGVIELNIHNGKHEVMKASLDIH